MVQGQIYSENYNKCRISEILTPERSKTGFFANMLRLYAVNLETTLSVDTYLLRLSYLLLLAFFRKS
jgi:hypothetical protein